MPSTNSRIVLSRFFNENVKLVANMCPRCYEELEDVIIVSVNLIFLKQTLTFKQLTDLDFLRINKIVPELDDQENEYGFSKDEIELSLRCSETLNKIIDSKTEVINKIERSLIGNDNFKGFTVDDIKESNKVVKACEKIRFKVYRRASMRALKNIYKSQVHRKQNVLKDSQALEYSQSKYFLISLENNNVNTVTIKEEYPEIEIKCEQCKISYGKCTDCTGKVDLESEYIDYESQYFKSLETQKTVLKPLSFIKSENALLKDEFEDKKFVPPRSPHNLIEECLYHDPWALLVATIFLNRTSCMCARPYVFWFLTENPDPIAVLDKYPKDLEKYFVKLGLQKRRALQVWRMTYDFIYKKWDGVKELYGIGSYGENAFRMFCLGDFSLEPKDRFLRMYKAWYEKVVMREGIT